MAKRGDEIYPRGGVTLDITHIKKHDCTILCKAGGTFVGSSDTDFSTKFPIQNVMCCKSLGDEKIVLVLDSGVLVGQYDSRTNSFNCSGTLQQSVLHYTIAVCGDKFVCGVLTETRMLCLWQVDDEGKIIEIARCENHDRRFLITQVTCLLINGNPIVIYGCTGNINLFKWNPLQQTDNIREFVPMPPTSKRMVEVIKLKSNGPFFSTLNVEGEINVFHVTSSESQLTFNFNHTVIVRENSSSMSDKQIVYYDMDETGTVACITETGFVGVHPINSKYTIELGRHGFNPSGICIGNRTIVSVAEPTLQFWTF